MVVPLKVGIFSIAKSLKHCEQMAVVNCDVIRQRTNLPKGPNVKSLFIGVFPNLPNNS